MAALSPVKSMAQAFDQMKEKNKDMEPVFTRGAEAELQTM